MQRDSDFLYRYFLFFGALSVIAVIPAGALTVLLITFPLAGLPGYLVIASPTILLYSFALLPLSAALTAPHRRLWRVTAATLVPVVVAIAPTLLSQREARQFGMRVSQDDISRAAATRPKSIELIGDGTSGMFVHGQSVGDEHASCNEVCRRLLFNGEADWVRMTRLPDRNERSAPIWRVTYRLEHREACPQLYSDGTTIEKAVRDRLISGDCLIWEAGDKAAPDATVEFLTRYSIHDYPPRPPDQAPSTATIETVKTLRIESRQAGVVTPVVQQTETVARTLALPFYIGSEMQGDYNGATLGRDKAVMKPIDLVEILGAAFGYQLSAISAPPPEDAGTIAERILAQPRETNSVLSAQQQDAVNDVLVAIGKQPTLSDADLDFVRRVIADHRVTDGKLGISFENMFRKHTARLEPLIPVVLDRIRARVPESVGHYHSMLGWSLINYSADSLRPYRDQMVAVVEAQPDWPSEGVLMRLAEVGGKAAVNLVIRRLDSSSVHQFAAVAACRAGDEAWLALEPAVLAHLTSPRPGNYLQDVEWSLMLALVRFGKRPLVADMIEKRGLLDKQRALTRLARFEPGFSLERCRDSF
jgi:hypothetical protein